MCYRGIKFKILKGLKRGLIFILLAISFQATVAQECNVIYVTPGGTSGGTAGTKANPASFSHALSIVNSSNDKIYMAAGTYVVSNAVNIPSGVTIEGGFDTDWKKSNGNATTIFRDNTNPIPGISALIGVNCVGVNNFRLQDLTIRVANAVGNGTSTYGVYLSGSSNYEMVRCRVIAGNGGNGSNGAPGTNGMNGAAGTDGEEGDEDGPCCRLGGQGAGGSFPGSNAGGDGGDGGERGTYIEWSADGEAFPGYIGSDGQGVGGGFGGAGGLGIFTTIISIQCDRTPVNDGEPGGDGADGVMGAPGTPGVANFLGGYYVPGTGTPGQVGTHGAGGGGGGGGGSQGGLFYETILNLIENTNGSGPGGGGGGEGGQAGTGGNGGNGGGSSFGVFIYNNGPSGLIRDCEFQSGLPGLGGLGGSGGAGGDGGDGGLGGGPFNCDIGAGGDGGEGGRGGSGGQGGKGSNGVTHSYYEWTGGTPVTQMNVNNLSQPIVKVQYSGCTNAPVYFSTDATGTVNWYFGAGSNPTTSSGTSSVCSYSTTGRKTFTMVVNGIAYTFSDFIDIFRSGVNAHPEIISSSDSVCIGDLGSFASSVSADDYYWTLVTGDDTLSVNGSNLQTLSDVPFDTAGNFTITLNTYSNCCGPSFPASFDIFVDSLIPPRIEIQGDFEDTTNTLCDGETATFSASAFDVGLNPTYQWQVNGSNTGTGPTYSPSNLSNGDQVSCIVTSSLLCATGMKDTSNVITVTVIDIPQVVCDADSFVTDEPTFFNAQVTSGGIAPYSYYWDFGDMTQGFGDSVAHIFTEDGTYEVNVEVVDSNGCASSCSTVVILGSALHAGFSASAFIGCAPFTVDFTNTSSNAITYFWNFGNGHYSADEEPSETYIFPGTYNVGMWAFNGEGNDSVFVQNQVMVLESPVANFQGYPENVTQQGDTVYFADNSVNATTWEWNFGDPNSGTDFNTSFEQNPYHVFSGNGIYDVTLIVTNDKGCADTLVIPSFILVNVGLEELSAANYFTITNLYPIPFVNTLNLEVFIPESDQLMIDISDLTGRNLGNLFNSTAVKGLQTIELNTSGLDLSQGIYLLNIQYKDRRITKKVILQSNATIK